MAAFQQAGNQPLAHIPGPAGYEYATLDAHVANSSKEEINLQYGGTTPLIAMEIAARF